jgi:hypothetical protein
MGKLNELRFFKGRSPNHQKKNQKNKTNQSNKQKNNQPHKEILNIPGHKGNAN